jgi:hypothetical protein
LGIATNLVAVAALVPMIFVLTSRFGAAGGASAWLMLNCGYLLFSLPLMHRRIIRGEQWRWYGTDVGLPLIAALGAALGGRLLFDRLGGQTFPRLGVLACLAAIGLFTAGASAIAAPAVRTRIFRAILGNGKRGA